MPNRKVHNYIGKMLGLDPRLVNAVNRDMDKPSRYLGPSHRKVMHSDIDAVMLMFKYKNPQAMIASKVHQLTDQLASSDPNLRKILAALEAFL